MVAFTQLTRRVRRAFPAFVAAVVFLSCLAITAHLAAGEGCQSISLSARTCGSAISLDMGPALPGLTFPLDPHLTTVAWLTVALPVVAIAGPQVLPPAPRSPPSLTA